VLTGGVPPRQLMTQLRSVREQERRHWEEMAYKYPALTATQQAPAVSAHAARELSRQLGATLVEYYRPAGGWCAFVASPGAVDHIPLPLVTDKLLARMTEWMGRLDFLERRGPISLGWLAEWHDAVVAPLGRSLPRGRPVVLAPVRPAARSAAGGGARPRQRALRR
jgi:hypothetical protein